MKNGFTLIELLGVIVILVIIALIATPIIIDLTDFTTTTLRYMDYMFKGCNVLERIDIRNATFYQAKNMTGMFQDVPSKIEIITKNDTTKAWLQERLGTNEDGTNKGVIKTVTELT